MSPLLQQNGFSLQRGDKLRVRVSITGSPAPKITWIKDGEIIEENFRCEMTVNDNEANLLIHDVEKSDSGKYEIQVENEFGSDSGVFCVTVSDRSEAPAGKLEVSEIDCDSCRLTWQAPAHDGGAEVTSYLIEKWDGAMGEWLKAGMATGNMKTMVVRKLKEGHEYRFVVNTGVS